MQTTSDIMSFGNSAGLVRAIFFLSFWLVLSGFALADLPAGLLASAIATWASLRLLPRSQVRPRHLLLARLMVRFLYQSIIAGIDVARRALDPRLPLHPGIVTYRSTCPTDPLRSGFCTLASLQPGLLPIGFDAQGDLAIHCLNVDQPVARQLTEEESRYLSALGWESRHA